MKPTLVSYLSHSHPSPVWLSWGVPHQADGFIDHNCAVHRGHVSYYVTHLSSLYLSCHAGNLQTEKAEHRESPSCVCICIYTTLSSPLSRRMSVYTATLLEDLARREKVAAMMRAGDWRAVINTFQGGEEARDPLEHWRDGREQCSTCRKREGEKGTEERGLHKGRWTDVGGCLMERASSGTAGQVRNLD